MNTYSTKTNNTVIERTTYKPFFIGLCDILGWPLLVFLPITAFVAIALIAKKQRNFVYDIFTGGFRTFKRRHAYLCLLILFIVSSISISYNYAQKTSPVFFMFLILFSVLAVPLFFFKKVANIEKDYCKSLTKKDCNELEQTELKQLDQKECFDTFTSDKSKL